MIISISDFKLIIECLMQKSDVFDIDSQNKKSNQKKLFIGCINRIHTDSINLTL